MKFTKALWQDEEFRKKMQKRHYGNSMRGKRHSANAKAKYGP